MTGAICGGDPDVASLIRATVVLTI